MKSEGQVLNYHLYKLAMFDVDCGTWWKINTSDPPPPFFK
jgi:hypothetical protein